ncbi:MAG: hypothetical protein A2X49_09630 [Lentisphaerae bacterium GWF2_52_8]|nr:MAG: hypothetical protein A2X49_09630 [Lentisphaerae bacterium GWF2_52_8]
MIDNIYRTASNMTLELRRQESIARNIAGATVPGYKQEFMVSDSFKSQLENAGANPLEQVTGTDSGKTCVDFSQGVMKDTGRKLDFALTGDAFFQVSGADGKLMYTRNGAFHISKDGNLETSEGYTVNGQGGNLTFSSTDILNNIEITSDGLLRVLQPDTGTMRDIGKLKIVKIDQKDNLDRLTASYFADTGRKANVADAVSGQYEVLSGYLEMANSSPMSQMSNMVQSARDFEMGQKLLKMLGDRFTQEIRTFTK